VRLLDRILPQPVGRRGGAVCYAAAVFGIATALITAIVLAGCAGLVDRQTIVFLNVTPGAPVSIAATLIRPAGPGPFPAVVQLHGCAGVEAQSFRWARWLAEHG